MRTGTSSSCPHLLPTTSLFLLFLSSASAAVVPPRDVATTDRSSAHQLTARYPTPVTDPAYIPAQVGGIVGAYAFCLASVAVLLLLLAKRRRDHLEGGDELAQQARLAPVEPPTFQLQDSILPTTLKSPPPARSTFATQPHQSHKSYQSLQSYEPRYPYQSSLASPTSIASRNNPFVSPSNASSIFRVPGVDPFVDQEVVSADRDMAQAQLEEMYKYVMEHEEAKAKGVVLESPPLPLRNSNGNNANHGNGFYNNGNTSAAAANMHQKNVSNGSSAGLLRKDKSKPQSLTLNLGAGEERTSRTSSILSALKSPRKKKMQGVNISAPIMTPMSGTFPPQMMDNFGGGGGGGGGNGTEPNGIPLRQYAPTAPPPVPTDQWSRQQQQQQQQQRFGGTGATTTPDITPISALSIDEQLGTAVANSNNSSSQTLADRSHNRNASTGTLGTVTEADPGSAVTADSAAPLVVGLPTSPKPGVNRFPSLASLSSLPASPRSGAFPASPRGGAFPASPRGGAFPMLAQAPTGSFSRANAPSAVRTGGALPFRAYEPSITSPSYATHAQTKQTVFEAMPQSPGGAPWTGAPVPYTPYQPFSPVVPMTPSLVTKADRKRMKRLEPKTPTVELVQSTEDTW